MDDFEVKAVPCVGSGLCCKTGPCAFGEWDAIKSQCAFLEESFTQGDVSIYRCGKYEEISQIKGAEWNPAFGAGCCMSLFNEARIKIIKIVNAGNLEAREAIGL